MKTLLAIVGGAVVLTAGSAAFYHYYYIPNYNKISFEKIDWLKKSIDWKTHFSTGTITFDQLSTLPNNTFGVSKGNDSLEIVRVSPDVMKFTLTRDGKTMQVQEIDFVKQTMPA